MSIKDINNADDAEFEALMQGTGDLAELLRTIPQPVPSAELDAAILARAESILTLSASSREQAANDAVLPESANRPRSFIARWKLPLGLAASVLLALPLALTQWRAPSKNESSVMISSAPPASPAADAGAPAATGSGPIAESVPQLAEAKQTAKPADRTLLAQAETEAPTDALRRAKQRPLMAAKDKATVSQPEPTENGRTAPTVLAKVDTAAKSEATAPASSAAAPGPQPFPATVPAEAKPAARIEPHRQSSNQDTQTAALDTRGGASGRMAAGDGVPAAAVGGALKSKSLRSEMAANEPRQTAETRPAEMMAGASATAPAAVPPAAARGVASESLAPAQPASPAAFPGSSSDNPSPEKARAWLSEVEKLIKADKRKEALEQWTKFRKTYPDYPVPKPLLDQITELQK